MRLEMNKRTMLTDTFKPLTVGFVVRLLSGQSLTDRTWHLSMIFSVAGFLIYNLLIDGMVDTNELAHESQQPLVKDVIKTFSRLTVANMLAGEKLDAEWLLGTLITVTGFAVYHVFVSNYVKGADICPDTRLADAINDWARAGTMLLLTPVLKGERVLKPAWVDRIGRTLLGLGVYHGGVNPLLEQVFDV